MWLEGYLTILKRGIFDNLQIGSKNRLSDGSVRQIYSVSTLYLLFLDIVKFSQNVFCIEFLKDLSTKLMPFVFANPFNFDNITLQVYKLQKSKTIESVQQIKFSSSYS